MSTPFDPNQWPDGYGPVARQGAGGDVPTPDDDGPPPLEDEDAPPSDPMTGELVDAAGGAPPAGGKKRPVKPKENPREAFLKWVQMQLSHVEAHGVPVRGKPAWCPEWWKHPEVVQRLYVSWKGYARAAKLQSEGDGLAKSAWWVQHWDHHARIIFDGTYGPFRACNSAGHLADNKGEALTIVPLMPPEDVELM